MKHKSAQNKIYAVKLFIAAFLLTLIFPFIKVNQIRAAGVSMSISGPSSVEGPEGTAYYSIELYTSQLMSGYSVEISVEGDASADSEYFYFEDQDGESAVSSASLPFTIYYEGDFVLKVAYTASVTDGNTPPEPDEGSASLSVTMTAPPTEPEPEPDPEPDPEPEPEPDPEPDPEPQPDPGDKDTPPETEPRESKKDEDSKDYSPASGKYVTISDIESRSGPGLGYDYLRNNPEGTVLNVIGVTSDGWYVVKQNGQDAYIAGSYLKPYDESSAGTKKTETAKTSTSKSSASTKTTSSTTTKSSASATSTEKGDDKASGMTALKDKKHKEDRGNKQLTAERRGIGVPHIILILLIILILVWLLSYFLKRRWNIRDDGYDDYDEGSAADGLAGGGNIGADENAGDQAGSSESSDSSNFSDNEEN